MHIHNFGAGPSILPQEVFEEASKSVLNYNNTGLSILEISHRSEDFLAILDESLNLIRSILDVPANYSIVFLQGGASSHFTLVPYNLLPQGAKAAYLDTGVWANKALQEVKIYGEPICVASSKDAVYNFIPKVFEVPNDARYLHITTNNTIYGTQIHTIPDVSVPLIADMSSDIFSKRIDINKFDLIYAGAQKNLGPAGVTIAIIKDGILGKSGRELSTMWDYQTYIDHNSNYNTPPVFAIYTCLLTLRWLKNKGGIEAIEQLNNRKAELLYKEIDRNSIFKGHAITEDRSKMNVTFTALNKGIENEFAKLCKESGLHGLEGHRTTGGFRASLYNALPMSSVEFLVGKMRALESTYN